MKKRIVSLVMLFSSLGSGCSTLIRGTTQPVTITSEPAGANIVIDGYDCGQTPQKVALARKFSHAISVEKQGYQRSTFFLEARKNNIDYLRPLTPLVTTVSGVACGGLLGGGIGLIAGVGSSMADSNSGANYDLVTQSVHFPLQP